MVRIMRQLASFIAACATTMSVHAANPTTLSNLTVKAINFKENQEVIIYTHAHSNLDEVCAGQPAQGLIIVLPEHPNQRGIVASAIAARVTNTRLQAHINGCYARWNREHPIVESLIWE